MPFVAYQIDRLCVFVDHNLLALLANDATPSKTHRQMRVRMLMARKALAFIRMEDVQRRPILGNAEPRGYANHSVCAPVTVGWSPCDGSAGVG